MAEQLISVEEAHNLVHTEVFDKPAESVPLLQALGRVTAAPWYADMDLPPFDRVMMDGVAIDFDSFQNGQRKFSIEGIQRAGTSQLTLRSKETGCIEVMTGAIRPQNTDVVIPYEQVITQDHECILQTDEVKHLQHIHLLGSDRKRGDLLLSSDMLIGPAEIGVAASIGLSDVLVRAVPAICIVSTGDELVEINQTPKPHQIRKSNVYALVALLNTSGLVADHRHAADDEEDLLRLLSEVLQKYDVVILSGGVSKGKFDLIPHVLETLGVEKIFHRIAQKPGKPMWFGRRQDVTVFGLPGNPVSTFLCAVRYVLPWLKKVTYFHHTQTSVARLTKDLTFKPGLTQFVQVKLWQDMSGKLFATPVLGGGSGDFANLILADAFMELPATGNATSGSDYPVWIFRW